jgi:hypothetical protein
LYGCTRVGQALAEVFLHFRGVYRNENEDVHVTETGASVVYASLHCVRSYSHVIKKEA